MSTITPHTEAKSLRQLLDEVTAERDVLLRQFGDVCSDCGALLTLCGPQDNDGEPTLDCQPCKLRAERDAYRACVKALVAALGMAGTTCGEIAHRPGQRHSLGAPCPVEARIAAALEAAAKLDL